MHCEADTEGDRSRNGSCFAGAKLSWDQKNQLLTAGSSLQTLPSQLKQDGAEHEPCCHVLPLVPLQPGGNPTFSITINPCP